MISNGVIITESEADRIVLIGLVMFVLILLLFNWWMKAEMNALYWRDECIESADLFRAYRDREG